MISITKGPEPKILIDNNVKWTSELLSYISSGVKIPKHVENRYNTTEVKDALLLESSGKCMYCESPIGHIAHEHIEHIKPKASSKFPGLCYTWNNLGLACPKCNMNKSDTYDLIHPFINPYVDDPDSNFIFFGTWIYPKGHNLRAEITIRVIELNRPDLIERRLERTKSIRRLIDSYNALPPSLLKDALLDEIFIEADVDFRRHQSSLRCAGRHPHPGPPQRAQCHHRLDTTGMCTES